MNIQFYAFFVRKSRWQNTRVYSEAEKLVDEISRLIIQKTRENLGSCLVGLVLFI